MASGHPPVYPVRQFRDCNYLQDPFDKSASPKVTISPLEIASRTWTWTTRDSRFRVIPNNKCPHHEFKLLALPRPTRYKPKSAKSASKKQLNGAGWRLLFFGNSLHAVLYWSGTMTPSLSNVVRVDTDTVESEHKMISIQTSASGEIFEGAKSENCHAVLWAEAKGENSCRRRWQPGVTAAGHSGP